MSRFSWSSGAPSERSRDLQHNPAIDPPCPTLNADSEVGETSFPTTESPEDVAALLKKWGRDRHERMMRQVDIDLWSGVSQELRNSRES